MMKLKKDIVNVLGTDYKIEIRSYEDDPEFKRLSGGLINDY